MTDFARILHDTPPADPSHPVRVPGESELDRLERQRRDGIDLDPAVVAKLEELARRA